MLSPSDKNTMGDLSNKNQSTEDIASPKQEQSAFKAGRSFLLAFISICIVTLAAALDATSLSVALPTITERLYGSAIQAFWSGTSFLVASAVIQPVVCALSHTFGRKLLILATALLFAIGSLIAAVAHNFTVIIVGRSIQGLGGGGILALGEVLVTDLIPLAARGSWLGWMSVTWALGTVGGPLMGGGFAQASHSSWRWIFWINLPMIGMGAVCLAMFLKVTKLRGSVLNKMRRFNWLGSLVFVASTVSFLVPITWGGVMYSWASWHTLVPLSIGLVGIAVSGLYEHRLSLRAFDSEGKEITGKHIQPIIRFTIFSNWTLRLLFLQTMVHGMVLWSLLYFLPLYYEGVKEYSPFISGVAVLPETLLIAPMSIIVGIVSSKTGRYRWAIWSGWANTTLGFGILYLLNPDTSIPAFIFMNVPVAIGTGLCFVSMSLGIQAACRPQDAAHAITFYSFIRVFGQSLGVAVGGVIFQNQIRRKTSKYPLLAPFAGQFSQDATAVVGLIKSMEDGTKKNQLIQAYSDALKIVWAVMSALSGAVLLSSIFVKGYSLNQELETLQGLDVGNNNIGTKERLQDTIRHSSAHRMVQKPEVNSSLDEDTVIFQSEMEETLDIR